MVQIFPCSSEITDSKLQLISEFWIKSNLTNSFKGKKKRWNTEETYTGEFFHKFSLEENNPKRNISYQPLEQETGEKQCYFKEKEETYIFDDH